MGLVRVEWLLRPNPCRRQGREVARHIRRATEDLLQVEHGLLYPALPRLERRGWVSARWQKAQESKWPPLAGAMARLMRGVEG
ncbi:MAG: helix-turn-helix transcriptional regulator [Acidobacteriia bacterium]|nr:helix-turn-helix transcriptional regulator [Terriglobia bacterium]